jgi:hypothetical protein
LEFAQASRRRPGCFSHDRRKLGRNGADAPSEACMKLVAVAILAAVIHSSASAQNLYDVRGLRLGASLSDIRKLPYPDGARWPDAKLICTGDPESTAIAPDFSTADDDLLKAGVVSCSYYRPAGRKFSPWGLDVAGTARMHVLLFFTPAGFPEEQRLRLYLISLEARTEHFDAVAAALKQTYGEPQQSRPLVYESEGKRYDNIRLGWQAAGGIVVMERYFYDAKTMYVTYQHQGLADAVDLVLPPAPR